MEKKNLPIGIEFYKKIIDEALNQIEDRKYADELSGDGYADIIKYGICFYKKNCRVKCCRD